MKKLFLIALTFLFAIGLSAQNVEDVWLLLQNKKIYPAQKKIEECMPVNQTNPRAWLFRGNVYLQVYQLDNERLKKDPSYQTRFPDAILTSYESFYKAIELDHDVAPITGLVDAKTGQLTCASEMFDIAGRAKKAGDNEKAIKYYNAAARALLLDEEKGRFYSGLAYYNVAIICYGIQDMEGYETALENAMKGNTTYDVIYRMAYNVASNKKDTVKCGDILKLAKKNVAKEERGPIYALELDYTSITNDSVAFEKCLKNVLKYTADSSVMRDCALSLANTKKFDMAIQLLDSAQLKTPDCFEIASAYAYTYFLQADEFTSLIKSVFSRTDLEMSERIALKNQYSEQQKSMMEKSYNWGLKAYNANANDPSNNSIVKQLGTQLGKDIPEGLK